MIIEEEKVEIVEDKAKVKEKVENKFLWQFFYV